MHQVILPLCFDAMPIYNRDGLAIIGVDRRCKDKIERNRGNLHGICEDTPFDNGGQVDVVNAYLVSSEGYKSIMSVLRDDRYKRWHNCKDAVSNPMSVLSKVDYSSLCQLLFSEDGDAYSEYDGFAIRLSNRTYVIDDHGFRSIKEIGYAHAFKQAVRNTFEHDYYEWFELNRRLYNDRVRQENARRGDYLAALLATL